MRPLLLVLIGVMPLFGQESITWVYPRRNMLVSTLDSILVIGRIQMPGRLYIEDHEIRLDIDGGFAGYIPLDVAKAGCDSSLLLRAVRVVGESRDTVLQKIFVPLPRTEWTALSFDPAYGLPSQRMILRGGDQIPLACRTLSGQSVFFSVVDSLGRVLLGPAAMIEKEPAIPSDIGNAVFGFEVRPRRIPTAGIYSSSVTISSQWRRARIRYFMIHERDTIQWTAPGTITGSEHPDYVRLTGDVNNAMVAPGRSYYYFLPAGTLCAVSGRIGSTLRLQLSERHSAWLPESQTTPALTPSVLSSIPVIRVRSTGRETSLRLFAASSLPYHVAQIDPRTFELRLFGGIADVDWIRFENEDRRIRSVSWSQPEDDVFAVRVVLNYDPVWGYRVRHDSLGLLWTLRHAPRESGLKGVRICVDPGHSPDIGATGSYGTQEHEANLWVARALAEELRNAGAIVTMTRIDSVRQLGLYDRVRIADESGADLFVSIHHNAPPDGVNPYGQNFGPSVIYYHMHSRMLAEEIQKELIRKTKLPDFGIFAGNIAVCRNPALPAVLVECAFLTLPEQERLVRDEKFRRQIARSIKDGIKNFVRRSAYRE